MKTKTRTFIGIVALGIIGFTNINATAGNIETSAYAVAEVEERLTIESWMLENELFAESALTKAEAVETEKALEIESWMIDERFFQGSESYTASGSDTEIEKYATKQVALHEEKESK